MTGRILLVEEESEAKAFTLAMKAAGLKSHVEVINDPDKAVDYCKGAGEFADRREFPAPDLVLVDVKLGKRTGLEVLKRIRDDCSLRNSIVVMMSSSRHLQDVAEAYSFGANAFVVKPTDREELKSLLKSVSQFWLTQNIPPPSI